MITNRNDKKCYPKSFGGKKMADNNFFPVARI